MSGFLSGSLIFLGFGRLFFVYLVFKLTVFYRIKKFIKFKCSHLLTTPLGSSIIFKIVVWSLESIGAIEMSLTALNWPQLFKCSFSSRKKFQTNRLKTSNNAKMLAIMSPLINLFSITMKAIPHANRSTKSSTIAK